MLDIFENLLEISVSEWRDMPLILQTETKTDTDMKTRMTIAVLIAVMPLFCGCKEDMKSEKTRTRFSLVHTRQDIYGKPCQTLWFNKTIKEDERDTAMKEVARQWDRNLHLMRPLIDVCRQDLSCHPAEHAEAALDVAEGCVAQR